MNEQNHTRPRFRLLFPDSTDEGRPREAEIDHDWVSAAQRFRGVEGVVFDMGDVLFDATAWRRWLLKILRRMGLQAGYRSLFNLWDRDYLDAVHRGDREYAEAFMSFLQDAGMSSAQIDEVVTASQQIKRQLESEVRLFPGVGETLNKLRTQGLRLGVLSDSESSAERLRQGLNNLGVGEFLACIVSSSELRRTKPHPLGYQTAMERLSLVPQRTVFVGHDAEELRGARRCGMKTIAFNYDRDASADCRISGFCDLLMLLGHDAGDDRSLLRAA